MTTKLLIAIDRFKFHHEYFNRDRNEAVADILDSLAAGQVICEAPEHDDCTCGNHVYFRELRRYMQEG
jgi:hypothetical protein